MICRLLWQMNGTSTAVPKLSEGGPADLDHPNHMLALEWVLRRSARTREAVTYEELAFAAAC
jgi:hypothetical protein